MTSAISAAVEVGRKHGVNAANPKVVQETNNTVVWLRPEPVIAKVATRTDARGDLRLEHAVAVELASVGAEIAVPLPEASPSAHNETGFVVTLWRRIEGARGVALSADELALSLRRLHGALGETKTKLPSFRAALVRAREALHNDGFMAALAPPDRSFLRVTIDDGLGLLANSTSRSDGCTANRMTPTAWSPQTVCGGSTSRAAVPGPLSGTSPSSLPK